MSCRNVRHDHECAGREWRKSSWSYGTGECVEVATPSGKSIDVRDSKNVQGVVLTFNPTRWHVFIANVRSGEFDF